MSRRSALQRLMAVWVACVMLGALVLPQEHVHESAGTDDHAAVEVHRHFESHVPVPAAPAVDHDDAAIQWIASSPAVPGGKTRELPMLAVSVHPAAAAPPLRQIRGVPGRSPDVFVHGPPVVDHDGLRAPPLPL